MGSHRRSILMFAIMLVPVVVTDCGSPYSEGGGGGAKTNGDATKSGAAPEGEAKPGLSATITPQPVRVATGASAVAKIHITRPTGANAPVSLGIAKLPAGITANGLVVPGDVTDVDVTLAAAVDAS